uniref:Septin interacting protein n=1 Tax=Anopheles culicifacies TaxID=139723 RepID=A0A182MCJ3_9DIPT
MSKQTDKEAEKIITYGTPTLSDWKIYLRNLQQNPSIHNMATPDSSSSESSFELEESFKALLDRKRREMQEKRGEERPLMEDDDVASREVAEVEKTATGNESTFLEQDSISKISDTSFEEMERICAVLDKVNGFDNSVKIQEDTGKHLAPTLQQSASITLGDVTQLEDIDEPSGLWENTVLPCLSPVKRMHILRPSTILEESTMSAPAEASKNSSIETYISARQGAESININSATSGSDVYRTAQDTFDTDSYARSSMLDSGLTSDLTGVDNRSNDHQDHQDGYSKNSTREADSLEEEQNVIILDSSESDIEDEQGKKEYKQVENDTLGNIVPLESMVSERDESLLEHDEPTSLMYDDHGESAYNYPDEVSVLDEMPDRFNDTLEETDFMMKQGLKLLALKKQQQQAQEHRLQTAQKETNVIVKPRTNSGSDDGSRPMLLTPTGKNAMKATPQGSHFSYLTPTGGMSSRLNVSHGAHSAGFKQALFSSTGKNIVAKNPPSGGAASVGSFKKPVSRLPHLKVTGRKFDHIVSPIGAYIKKTPQSMLQTKINCHNKNLIDVLHSENRDSAASTGSNHGCKENQGVNLKGYTSSLPGKGVISSNRAHVLDERNVVRIPGGEKMQKLINSSPTMVIRHEGRIKYAEQTAGSDRKLTLNMSAMTDDSLADLSVLSSDVSVRVLKDAKRYN